MGTTLIFFPATNPIVKLLASKPKSCDISGQSIPYNLTIFAKPSLETIKVSPSKTCTTLACHYAATDIGYKKRKEAIQKRTEDHFKTLLLNNPKLYQTPIFSFSPIRQLFFDRFIKINMIRSSYLKSNIIKVVRWFFQKFNEY